MRAAIVRSLGSPLEVADAANHVLDASTDDAAEEIQRLGSAHAVVRESRSLDDVNACIDEVLSGEVSARLVFDLPSDVAV